MTRDEIVQLILNVLLSSENINVPNSSYIDEESLSEEVLSALEEDGVVSFDTEGNLSTI